jgi:TRAP-type C4-dicarboxylate transport system permease small subunit
MKKIIARVSALFEAFEKLVLISALFGMLVTVCVAIVARPPWTTPLVLALMIVATFAGAALATATRRHITMDLLSKALGQKGRAALSMVTSLIGAGITSVLATAGSHWVRANMDFDDPISLALKVPDWWLQTVVPAGFALCTLHFVLNFFQDAVGLATNDLSHLPDPMTGGAHGVPEVHS